MRENTFKQATKRLHLAQTSNFLLEVCVCIETMEYLDAPFTNGLVANSHLVGGLSGA